MDHSRSSTSNVASSITRSPWLWGGGAAWLFYLALPQFPRGKELLTRYCCSHPLEYVETGLFFVGVAIIALKFLQLRKERQALASQPQLGPEEPAEDIATSVGFLRERLESWNPALRDTYWGRRLGHLLSFFQGRPDGDGIGDHLTYLSEAEADRLHTSHSLLQTVIWAIPILGFLGTVMGITLAIANVTPEQLDSSLNDVTGGLAVAFDTTALALAFSLVLGFASLFVKRAEERLLVEADELCRLEIHRCYPTGASSSRALLAAEEEAARELIDRTSAMIDRQTAVWTQAVENIRSQWGSTLDEQRLRLVDTLQTGASDTLSEHAGQLALTRQQLLDSHEQMSARLVGHLDQFFRQRQQAEHHLLRTMGELADKVGAAAQAQGERQAAEVDRLLTGMQSHFERWQTQSQHWQDQLATVAQALTTQSGTLVRHGEQLERIAAHEGSLVRLQDHLVQNLEAVRAAETFDETLHNLNAAVHLLTARVRVRDAA